MADTPHVDRNRSFAPPLTPLPESTRRILSEMRLLLGPIVSAQRVWDQLLDGQEREKLGNDLVAAYEQFRGTVGIWLSLHPVWFPRAVIHLARGIGFLSESNYRWLEREISSADPTLSDSNRAAPRPEDSDDDPGDRIEQARHKHQLLLVGGNGHHRLYWEGKWERKKMERQSEDLGVSLEPCRSGEDRPCYSMGPAGWQKPKRCCR